MKIYETLKTLRDKHGFVLWVCPVRSEKGELLGWYYEGEWNDGRDNNTFYNYPEELWKTYEDAELAGIEYAKIELKK